MRLLGKITISLIALAFAVAGASAAGLVNLRPSLGSIGGQFSYIKAWSEFGVSVDADASASSGFSVSAVRNLADGSALKAIWDGSTAFVDERTSSWSIPVLIGSGASQQKARLVSSWTDKALFPWGVATIGIEGQLTDMKAAYAAQISLIGSEVFAAKNGSHAVIKWAQIDQDGLFTYLIARPMKQEVSFKASSLKKAGVNVGVISFEAALTGSQPLSGAQAVELTIVRAMADEDVMSLAKAWVASSANPEDKRPDVRLTGTVDKPKVNPGEAVRYTYYLFNAGMDQAKGLSVSIPVPQGGKLVKGSIKGDNGKAILHPSGAAIDLGAGTDADSGAYEGATEISWAPSGNLRPGAVMKFSFDFMVR